MCPTAQVFGVTTDPLIVYTSNLFAILSLRALYGFVATIMSELRYLDKSVAIVLGFVGMRELSFAMCPLKMLVVEHNFTQVIDRSVFSMSVLYQS